MRTTENTLADGMKFPLGNILMTPGAAAIAAGGVNLGELLFRHAAADWSDMTPDDQDANAHALITGARVFSAYDTPAGRIWIITEADDREYTTILTPEEY